MTRPIAQMLRFHGAVSWLLFAEAAFTVAILANTLSILGGHASLSRAPSGFQEAGTVIVDIDEFDGGDAALRLREDLAALSRIPGVARVALVNGIPFGGDSSTEVANALSMASTRVEASIIQAGPGAPEALGVRVTHGRAFEHGDFVQGPGTPSVVMVSQALANRLFPHGSPLGRAIYLHGSERLRVIGVSRWLTRPSPLPSRGRDNGLALLVPVVPQPAHATFVLQVRPQDAAAVIASVGRGDRTFGHPHGIDRATTLAESRRRYFAVADSDAKLLIAATVAVGLFSHAGISALVAFVVATRRRSIGICRAIGASRARVAFETWLLLSTPVLAGALAGLLLARAIHALLATQFPLARLSLAFPAAAAAMVLALAWCAMAAPMLNAARSDPRDAMRS